MKQFIEKHMNWYHLSGMVFGLIISFFYWSKAGKFSDYILKNNIFLISLFGIALGYITFDLIISALKRMKE